MNRPNAWTDFLGVAASIACAIHCAAMPFVVAFLPALGLSFLADEGFHQVMVVVCLVLAAAAFVPGWRRHRRWLPAGIASVGLALIATAAFALEEQCCANCEIPAPMPATDVQAAACDEACCPLCPEDSGSTESQAPDVADTPSQTNTAALTLPSLAWITPLGGLLLVSAHLTNRQLACSCGCCPDASA